MTVTFAQSSIHVAARDHRPPGQHESNQAALHVHTGSLTHHLAPPQKNNKKLYDIC